MFIVNINKCHFIMAIGTFQRIIAKREKYVIAPHGKASHKRKFFFLYRFKQMSVDITVTGIKSVVAGHFKVLFRYVLDKQLYKVKNGDGFLHVDIIFVAVVMEGYIFTIVGVDAVQGDDRATKISAYIFNYDIGVTEVWLCIDVKSVFIFAVNKGFCPFERRTDTLFKLIQQSSLKRFTQQRIVKVFYPAPDGIVRETAFSNEAVDMRVPFKRSAKSVENTNETGNKVL